jgi:hypothetical protein
MVIAGAMLLVLAALVVVTAAFCQLAGAHLTAPLKVGICAAAALLTVVGVTALVAPGATALSAAPAPVPTTSPADGPSEGEMKAIAWMHRNTVEMFIDRPGFGIRRLILPLDDVVKGPKAQGNKGAADKSPRDAGAFPLIKAKKPNEKTHYDVQDAVGKPDPLVGGSQILTDDHKEQWVVGKVQLVGLVKHKEPVAYVTEKMPAMKDVKEVPTRELNDFEKNALDAIRGGDNLNAEKVGKEMRVLGPIYAGQRCTTCHENKGQLLGAFSYQLERVPIETEKNVTGRRIP